MTFGDLNPPGGCPLCEQVGLRDLGEAGDGRGRAGVIDAYDLIGWFKALFEAGRIGPPADGLPMGIVGVDYVDGGPPDFLDPFDDGMFMETGLDSHGTAVAGIIAAAGDNGWGLAGLAWGARVMPVRVLRQDGEGVMSDFLGAAYFARTHGAQVLNASFGTYEEEIPAEAAEECKRFADEFLAGMLITMPAGNQGYVLDGNARDFLICPQTITSGNILVAAATTRDGTLSAMTNRMLPGGSDRPPLRSYTVHLAAPGDNVPVLQVEAPGAPTSAFSPAIRSGTSLSAAHVAGVGALLAAAAPELWAGGDASVPARWISLLATPRDALGGKVKYGIVHAGRVLRPPAGNYVYRPATPLFDSSDEGDQDHDGLSDEAENEIARAFAPYVVFDEEERSRRTDVYNGQGEWLGSEPITLFQLERRWSLAGAPTCPEGDEDRCFTLGYLMLYADQRATVSHHGDNETVYLWLKLGDDGSLGVEQLRYDAHGHHLLLTGDLLEYGTCEDAEIGQSRCEELLALVATLPGHWHGANAVMRGDASRHPVVYADQNQHGSHPSIAECEPGYVYVLDCALDYADRPPLVLPLPQFAFIPRFRAGSDAATLARNRNVGEWCPDPDPAHAGRSITPAAHLIESLYLLGFPDEVVWSRECGSACEPQFCGGLAGPRGCGQCGYDCAPDNWSKLVQDYPCPR
ncbi:MAG: S8 family serine peptidase [Deltaproteobacteria bacterium]|nr:S8 family serine peptidase [Deltaproteobacteria bacterium]